MLLSSWLEFECLEGVCGLGFAELAERFPGRLGCARSDFGSCAYELNHLNGTTTFGNQVLWHTLELGCDARWMLENDIVAERLQILRVVLKMGLSVNAGK